MAKTVAELVKELQFKKQWTIEEVAKSIGYSRVHLTNVMKKGDNPDIKAMLLEKHKDILQNVNSGEGLDRDPRDQELIDSLYARIEDLKSQVSLNDFAETLIRIESKLDSQISIMDPDEATPRSSKPRAKKVVKKPGKSS
jgi:transcriptional regulator with XRE-family HTH domain